MIDSRTDIVQYYSEWLRNRFDAGYLYVRNPSYPTKVHKIVLDEKHVDAVLFTSKDYSKAIDLIAEIGKRWPVLCQYTITAYGKDIEPNVPSINESIETCIKLSDTLGKDKIMWRYDPVLLTEKYTIERHAATFSYMCDRLSQYVNRCIYSYVTLYEKVKKHMPELNACNDEQKIELAKLFGKIASDHSMTVQTCNCNLDFSAYGVQQSGCITKELLNSVLGLNVKNLKPNGSLGCSFCYPVTNIGEYNTCLNKCRYCYASVDFSKCDENYAKHDPNSPYLIGNGTQYDEIVEMKPNSVKSPVLELF